GDELLTDAEPGGELADQLERRHALALLDPRDVRGGAAGERQLALAQPRRLARLAQSTAESNRVVVVLDLLATAPFLHRSHSCDTDGSCQQLPHPSDRRRKLLSSPGASGCTAHNH